MTQRFFTSDLHIRHDLAVGYRGFRLEDGTVDHDAYERTLAENWDSRVSKDDIVYVLGDIALNPRKGAFEWLDARPGRKILISGNHDEVASFHSKASKAQREWLKYFESVHDFLQIKIGGQRVLLSHYPYSGEGTRDIEDRHTQFRLRDEGQPLLHGHIHSSEDPANGHQLHVGLDAWNLELVHEKTVEDWLSGVNETTSF